MFGQNHVNDFKGKYRHRPNNRKRPLNIWELKIEMKADFVLPFANWFPKCLQAIKRFPQA